MLINCNKCVEDLHDQCNDPESCLCAKECNHNQPKYVIKDDAIPSFEEFKEDLKKNPVRYHRDSQSTVSNVASILMMKYYFITIIEKDEICCFNGKIFDSKGVEALIHKEAENRIINCRKKDRNEVLSKIKVLTAKSIDEFDSDPYLLTLSNGILDLRTLKISPHSPLHLTRILYPVNYDKPKTKSLEKNLGDTLFWKSLKQSFTIDGKFQKDRFMTVLEMIASVFVRTQVDERSFINLGSGQNGKSTFLEYIISMLGNENISSISLQQFSDNRFATVHLDGKTANITTDISSNELQKTGQFKILSSGEGMFVEQKNKHGYIFHNNAKLIFSCNRFPKVYDQSQGFFRRWIIIKWDRDFEKDPDSIPDIKSKLKENRDEMNLVFSNLVEISKRLLDTNKYEYSKDWKFNQKIWNENADVLKWFVDTWCFRGKFSKSKIDTYEFYKNKMFDIGEPPLGIGRFSKGFAEYFEDSKNDGMRIWLNLEFREPKQETLKEVDDR